MSRFNSRNVTIQTIFWPRNVTIHFNRLSDGSSRRPTLLYRNRIVIGTPSFFFAYETSPLAPIEQAQSLQLLAESYDVPSFKSRLRNDVDVADIRTCSVSIRLAPDYFKHGPTGAS